MFGRKKEEEKDKKPFNVILLGNIESEKEALIHKLIKKRFAINQISKINKSVDNKYTTKNITDIMNSIEIHGETVNMKIYDKTSASKIFSYSNKSLSSAQGIILLYSVCDRNSFNILKSNLHKIMSMNKYDFPMVMVGNESDSSNRQVNYEEAKALADSYGLSFYEVSINSGLGIGNMFQDLGEQVVFREYGSGNNFIKNNKSMVNNKNSYNLDENCSNQKKKNKNISIYANNDLYENEFNQNIKEKMLRNKLSSNSYILSQNKTKSKTNYKTLTNESKSDLELENSINSFKNNNKTNKTKNSFIIKSPDLVSSSVILSYRGSTEAQKKREEEIRIKRLLREKEMKTWWKKREKENLEIQKRKKLKEKKELKEKIKKDKIIQKEKERKCMEENLMKVKLNYEQKKQNNKITEQDIINKKENMRREKIQEKRNNKEMLNKLREEREIEEKEKEKEKFLLDYKNIHDKNINNSKVITNRNDQKKTLHKKCKTERLLYKTEKEKNRTPKKLSEKNSYILKDEQITASTPTHIYESMDNLIENYKNNSNIFRCLKCRLIPDILFNESNQEIETNCDHSYKDNLHYNITTYSNFIEKSLNHPIDNNNIFCFYCKKYVNELPDEKNIFICQKCDTYFCSDHEEYHKQLMHIIKENIKEKYLNISKNKIKEKNASKKSSKLIMTPMQNKFNKKMIKQNTTPLLYKKSNNKILLKKSNNIDNEANRNSQNLKNNSNNKKQLNNIPFYLIDSYCRMHNEVFKFYCFNCHENFCEICLKNHSNHQIIHFNDILLSNEELNSKRNELNKAKEDLVKLNEYFSALIEAIKCKFERLFNIKKKELEIKEKIINDYETIKYNYHSINNIRNIKFENNNKFLDLSPNTDWFKRFNLIFKYLNTNLSTNENDIFELLKSNITNEKSSKNKIISKNNHINKLKKLILLENEDILALNENDNIIIFDKDKLEEKLNIKLSEKNKCYINDVTLRNGGGIIINGNGFINFINLELNNQNYFIENEIKDFGNNINSVIEFNNNLIISLNDLSKIKLWKKENKYKYNFMDYYGYNNADNNNDEKSNIIKIYSNSFVLSSEKENCLFKFIINNNDKVELEQKLENIIFAKGNKDNNLINIPNENYMLVSCVDSILLICKNKFNIIQKFSHNYKLNNLYIYSEKYFIALDANNSLHKIEFDKSQQKLFFEDNINFNNNYPNLKDEINNIIIHADREKIILQMEDRFIKISNSV